MPVYLTTGSIIAIVCGVSVTTMFCHYMDLRYGYNFKLYTDKVYMHSSPSA